MIIGVVVKDPWPISGTELVIVTTPSRSIRSHWFGANTPGVCARARIGRAKPIVSPAPTARPPLRISRRLTSGVITRLPS